MLTSNAEPGTRGGSPQRQLCENLACNITVTIQDAADMDTAKQYIRTRHNNIRCFPKCGKVHRTKSFCGTPLSVTVSLSNSAPLAPLLNDVHVIGEFRNLRKPASFALMGQCTQKQREQPAFVPGQLQELDGVAAFIINPPRKWRYRARIAQVLDMHVFTVYVIFQDTVVGIKDSPQFQVIPIWKADESMLKNGDDVDDEDEEDEEVDANNEDIDDRGDKTQGGRLVHQDSFSKRARNEQQQQGQTFTGYQLHSDGSSSLQGSQQSIQAQGVTANTLGNLIGLPLYTNQTMSNLRLGGLLSSTSQQTTIPEGDHRNKVQGGGGNHSNIMSPTAATTAPRIIQPPPGFMTNHISSPRSPSSSSLSTGGNSITSTGQVLPNPFMLHSSGFGTGNGQSHAGHSAAFGSSNGQSAFGPSNGQSSFGSSNGQSAFGPSNGQSAFGPNNGQSAFGPNNGQSAFGPNNGQSSFGSSNGQSHVGGGSGFPSFFPSSALAAGGVHLGPEAFSHMQLNMMGAYPTPDPAGGMHHHQESSMVTAASQANHPGQNTAASDPLRENRFLSNLLSNAYMTGQAINTVVSQSGNNQQQQQYYSSLGMVPPTPAVMAAAYASNLGHGMNGNMNGNSNGSANAVHSGPGSTRGFGNQFLPSTSSAFQQPHASQQQQQQGTMSNSSLSSQVPSIWMQQEQMRPGGSGGGGLSNSKNVKDKHQD